MFYRSKRELIGDWINYIFLAVIALTMIFPFFYIFIVSFSSLSDFLKRDVILWPDHWVTDAYRYILQSDPFIRSLYVTGVITVVGTAVNLIMTSTMAYALTRPIIGKRLILFGVMATALFNAGLIPNYLLVRDLHLLDTIWALILPGAISPFSLIVMRQFFLSIPEDLTEAALLDGANEMQIYTRIILPLSRPALAAFGLFYAVGHWNNYFSAILYIDNPALWPIQVVLRQIVILDQPSTLGQPADFLENMPPPETIQMAAIIVATIPILVVYPFLQKHFAKGVLIGAVK